MTENSELAGIRGIVEPIASDLDLDVYDIERRGVTVRVTLDTHAGSEGGITLDNLSLATRLISREIDHEDPISTRFTLEVTSPGLERQLRVPAHFQREVGKAITVRFRDPDADPRRIDGQLTAATEVSATLLLDDGSEVTFDLEGVDKARTVFEWGPGPKPGAPKKPGNKQPAASKKASAKKPAASKQANSKRSAASNLTSDSEQRSDQDSDQDSDLDTQKEKQTS
jgi:ribosome maturation factor RimP